VTRAGTSLQWFVGTRLLGFNHPTFHRTFPIDVAPDVVTLNPADPATPVHPEPPAPWTRK
jgi:hypothetical protein